MMHSFVFAFDSEARSKVHSRALHPYNSNSNPGLDSLDSTRVREEQRAGHHEELARAEDPARRDVRRHVAHAHRRDEALRAAAREFLAATVGEGAAYGDAEGDAGGGRERVFVGTGGEERRGGRLTCGGPR